MSDVQSVVRLLYVAVFFAPLLLYPLAFERLFASTAVGMVAPWIMVGSLVVLGFEDVEWIAAWAAFAVLPMVLELWRYRTRLPVWWLAVPLVAASFANSMRSQAGLGVALSALVALALHRSLWRFKLAALPLALAAYLSITPLGFAGLRALRADQVGKPPSATNNAHVIWHSLYIGMGYLPNKYGIRWNDQVAIDAAAAYRPSAKFGTPAYDAAVRHVFIKLVERDPLLFVKSSAAKLIVVLASVSPLLLILGAFGLALGADRGRSPPVRQLPADRAADGDRRADTAGVGRSLHALPAWVDRQPGVLLPAERLVGAGAGVRPGRHGRTHHARVPSARRLAPRLTAAAGNGAGGFRHAPRPRGGRICDP